MNGYTREELIGQSIDILNVPPVGPEEFAASLEHLQREGVLHAVEAVHRHKDGHVFPIEYSTSLITVDGRELVLGIDRDITERKQVEEDLNRLNLRLQDELAERQRLVQSLQESEQRFRLVFDTSPDAIFLFDPHDPAEIWSIVDCNPSACKMNGYTREELIGQSIDMLNMDER